MAWWWKENWWWREAGSVTHVCVCMCVSPCLCVLVWSCKQAPVCGCLCAHTLVCWKREGLGDQSHIWELSLGRLEDRSEEPWTPKSLALTLRVVMLSQGDVLREAAQGNRSVRKRLQDGKLEEVGKAERQEEQSLDIPTGSSQEPLWEVVGSATWRKRHHTAGGVSNSVASPQSASSSPPWALGSSREGPRHLPSLKPLYLQQGSYPTPQFYNFSFFLANHTCVARRCLQILFWWLINSTVATEVTHHDYPLSSAFV